MTLNKAVCEMIKILKLLKVEDKKNMWERTWDSSIPRINARIFVTNMYNKEIAPYLDISAMTTITQISFEYLNSSPRIEFNKLANKYGYFDEYEIMALNAMCFEVHER